MKRIVFSVICILSLFLIASCDLLGGSLTEYISEYTTSAAIGGNSFINQRSPEEIKASSMTPDNNPILLLRNPMKFECIFEYKFNNSAVQKYYDANYTKSAIKYESIETDNSQYKMIFPKDFLEYIDSCRLSGPDGEPVKDISGVVSVYEKETERPFGGYNLTLQVNSSPEIGSTILQLDQDPDTTSVDIHYVVCFKIKRSTYNYDFSTISINNNVWNVSIKDEKISLSPKGTCTGKMYVNPEETPEIHPVETGGTDFIYEEGYDLFYYYTGDARKSTETSYNLTITDKAGLSATASVSSKTEMLHMVTISYTPQKGEKLTAEDTGTYTFTIKHDGKALNGASTGKKPEITCTVTGDGYNETFTGTSPLDVSVPIGTTYTLTANASCPGYLENNAVTTNTFNILHSPQFYVSANGNADGNGTLTSPCSTFSGCLNEISKYTEAWGSPSEGVFINVLTDVTASGNDFTEGYLINNMGYNSQVTIRGWDTGSKVTAPRTIDVKGSATTGNRGALSWTGGNLTVDNITFKGGYGKDLNGAGIILTDTATAITAKLTNCVIEGNTLVSSSSFYGGAGLAVVTEQADSCVIISNCTFKDNSISGNAGGAGIYCRGNTILADSEISGNTAETGPAGAGIYTGGGLSLSGSVTIQNNKTDERESNLYIRKGATITVAGKLSGSIGIAIEGEPLSEDNPPVVFATYTQENKPDKDLFFSDNTGNNGKAIPIKLTATEARFEYTDDTEGSGSFTILEQLYDDILLSVTRKDDNGNKLYKLAFTNNSTIISDVKVTSVSMKYLNTIDASDTTWTWDSDISGITLYSALIDKMKKAQQIPMITVVFEYNEHIYTCNFQPVVE